MLKLVESRLNQEKETILSQQQTQNLLLTNLQTIQVCAIYCLLLQTRASTFPDDNCLFLKATLERSETDTRQRLNSQLEKQEREISQLQKRLEHEVEQRHLLSRNQEVSMKLNTRLFHLNHVRRNSCEMLLNYHCLLCSKKNLATSFNSKMHLHDSL